MPESRKKLTASYLANMDSKSLFTLVFELDAEVERLHELLALIKWNYDDVLALSIVKQIDSLLQEAGDGE